MQSIVIAAGESSKNLESCQKIWDELINFGANRNTHLICLGGGVITDIGAYAASCFQRGIRFSLIPTSLLAMVDASIGGKCGIDYKGLKNYIGLFSRPQELIINSTFLSTLADADYRNGLMEMLKHGLIANANHFNEVAEHVINASRVSDELILHSIEIKKKHTELDPFESGIRKRLNFGHTLGHALESIALNEGKEIAHGLAVGIGMLGEAFLSYQYWSLNKKELEKIEHVLRTLLQEIPADWLNIEKLYPYMTKDKKNHNNQIQFSLLAHIGCAQENIPLDRTQIDTAVNYLLALHD